jgi:hypothetical protein
VRLWFQFPILKNSNLLLFIFSLGKWGLLFGVTLYSSKTGTSLGFLEVLSKYDIKEAIKEMIKIYYLAKF